MKKLILIAVMALFSSGVFAAGHKKGQKIEEKVEITESNSLKSKIEILTNLKDKKIECFDDYAITSSCGITATWKRKCFSDDLWVGVMQHVIIGIQLEMICMGMAI